jgi:hypothetical protein
LGGIVVAEVLLVMNATVMRRCLKTVLTLAALSLAACTSQKPYHPTLGFNHIKNVTPIMNLDAMAEEYGLEKELQRLPGDQSVKAVQQEQQHLMDRFRQEQQHLMDKFIAGFDNSKECDGITSYLKTDENPDFTIQITVGHDAFNGAESWTWTLSRPGDPSYKAYGTGWTRNPDAKMVLPLSNAELTAKDVCITAWNEIDPDHFKKPLNRVSIAPSVES